MKNRTKKESIPSQQEMDSERLNPKELIGITTPGRKPLTWLRSETIKLLNETAPIAMKFLRDVLTSKVPANQVRVDVAKFVINQAVGMATQRQEIISKPMVSINNITIDALDMAKALHEIEQARIGYAVKVLPVGVTSSTGALDVSKSG